MFEAANVRFSTYEILSQVVSFELLMLLNSANYSKGTFRFQQFWFDSVMFSLGKKVNNKKEKRQTKGTEVTEPRDA